MDLLVRHLVSILALLLLLDWDSILILHKSLSFWWFYLHRAVAASASAGTAPPSSATSPLALPVGSTAAPSAPAPSSVALAEAAQLVQE